MGMHTLLYTLGTQSCLTFMESWQLWLGRDLHGCLQIHLLLQALLLPPPESARQPTLPANGALTTTGVDLCSGGR